MRFWFPGHHIGTGERMLNLPEDKDIQQLAKKRNFNIRDNKVGRRHPSPQRGRMFPRQKLKERDFGIGRKLKY